MKVTAGSERRSVCESSALPDGTRLTTRPMRQSIQHRAALTIEDLTQSAASGEELSFASACHGAGRAMSRHAAFKSWSGRQAFKYLADQGLIMRSPSVHGVAEEAPDAYEDVGAVVLAAEEAGLAKRVARLRPVVCIKG